MKKNIIKKKESWKLFNLISKRYDFLNHFLSFGQDIFWRQQVKQYLSKKKDLIYLDIATGTCDLMIALIKNSKKIKKALGVDLAENMLFEGEKKIKRAKLNHIASTKVADAVNLPFKNNTYDLTTIAFGIRNTPEPLKALKEQYRVLKFEGRTIVLEFSIPFKKTVRFFYLFYFRKILPKIGAFFSGNSEAYLYLNESVESFSYGWKFVNLMEKAGFTKCRQIPLTFGIASIYLGEKNNKC